MIRQTFLTLATVFFAILTLVTMPVNAAAVSNSGTELQGNQYSQTVQGFNQSEAVQYAQISWPFQKDQNQGKQTQQQSQEPQTQVRNQGNQAQQSGQESQIQVRDQNNQSEQPQYEQQQQSPNQTSSQNNQEQPDQKPA